MLSNLYLAIYNFGSSKLAFKYSIEFAVGRIFSYYLFFFNFPEKIIRLVKIIAPKQMENALQIFAIALKEKQD